METDVRIQEDSDEQVEIDYEVSDEPVEPEKKTPEVDPTLARLEQLERDNRDLSTRLAGVGSQKDLIAGLKEVLGERTDTSQLAPKDQKSFEEELAGIRDELLDNPDKALKRYSQLLLKHEIAPVIGMLNNEIVSLRNEIDQTKISGDPVFKDVLENYGDEVKKVQATLQAQGVRDALKQAVNQVSLGHMTEIIGRQVAAAKPAESGPEALRAPEPGQPEGPKKRVIRLTPGEDQHRQMLGLGFEDYVSMYKKS